MRARAFGSAAFCGAILALAGCAAPGDDAPEDPSDTAASPVGEVWGWSRLGGSDPIEVSRPGLYTLEFENDGRYLVRADCNTGSGNYTVEGSRLTLGPGMMTRAACPPGSLSDQFVRLLGSVIGSSLRGDRLILELDGDDGELELVARKKVDLAGTSWVIRGYNNGKQAVVSVTLGTSLTAVFDGDGGFGGSAGCNRYSTSYEIDGNAMTIGPAAATRMMCSEPEGVMEQEAAFLAALGTVATYEIRGERLQMRTADGSLAVDLVAAVTGTVSHLVRRALPPNAEVRVELQDVSRQDVPAIVLGEQVFAAGGKQVPFPFEVVFDPADIDPRHSYSVRATITVERRLLFTSTRVYPVLTRDEPTFGLEVQVDPVGGD